MEDRHRLEGVLERSFRRTGRGWEDSIRMDLRETWWEFME